VEELTSQSDDGKSTIAIKFLPSVDIDDALQKVRDKVDQASGDLPSDLEDDPVVSEMNFSDMPIIQVVLSGPFSLKRLKVFAEELEDRFESIPGVLDAASLAALSVKSTWSSTWTASEPTRCLSPPCCSPWSAAT
jgi:multidrug efflux pump